MSVADKKGVGIDLSKCRSRHHQTAAATFRIRQQAQAFSFGNREFHQAKATAVSHPP